ncbi:MAG: penicillin-binding protein 2 [Sandaracinus sp.]
MSLLSVRREVGEFRKRYKWMAAFVVIVFTGLAARMMDLQVIEHAHYAEIARENVTKTLPLRATRGVIRDTEGRVIVTNRPSYDVYLTPSRLRDGDVERLESLMGLSEEARAHFEQRLSEIPERRLTHQIRFFTDISRESLAALETHEQDFVDDHGHSPLDVVVSPVRTYPYRALGAHAIGYLNELRPEELAELRGAGYHLGDLVGRTGLERAWESLLRGRRGYRRVLVDDDVEIDPALLADDRPELVEPVPGRDVTLTLDMELMRIIERAFRGRASGAAVVVDVRTGAVRALFSKPSYDPEIFTAGLSREEYAELRDDPFRPLIDKTIYETYFPASTFKPFAALAALQDGLIDPSERVECTGQYSIGTGAGARHPRCTGVHGEVDMRLGLVQSCNIYFYHLAEVVGIDRLAHMAQDFGLGRRCGIGINSEASGFIPTREWYESHHAWQGGLALNTAIGQGDTRVTLVQLAMAYAAIANGGTLYVPQLVERVSAPDGTTVEEFQPRVRRRVHVDPEHLAYVIDSLYGVVNDEIGTAHQARLDHPGDVTIAGKTGTAQIGGRIRSEEEATRAAYERRAHAWFAGFAPVEDPEVAIVVLVEHGGSGGRFAAPIAVQILQEYLGGREQATTAEADVTRTAGAH